VFGKVAVYPDERVDDQRLVHGATPRAEDVERSFGAERGSIRTIRRQRVEAIGH
jgi:hypothetical protein